MHASFVNRWHPDCTGCDPVQSGFCSQAKKHTCFRSHLILCRWDKRHFPVVVCLVFVSVIQSAILHDWKRLIKKVYNEIERIISSVIIVAGIVSLYSIIMGAKVSKPLLINCNHLSSYYKIYKTKKCLILGKYLFVHPNELL